MLSRKHNTKLVHLVLPDTCGLVYMDLRPIKTKKILGGFGHFFEILTHSAPCAVHSRLELICVSMAPLASLFLNVRPQAEVEGVQIL